MNESEEDVGVPGHFGRVVRHAAEVFIGPESAAGAIAAAASLLVLCVGSPELAKQATEIMSLPAAIVTASLAGVAAVHPIESAKLAYEVGSAVAKEVAHVAGVGAKVLNETIKTLLPHPFFPAEGTKRGEHVGRDLAIDAVGTVAACLGINAAFPGVDPITTVGFGYSAARTLHRVADRAVATIRTKVATANT